MNQATLNLVSNRTPAAAPVAVNAPSRPWWQFFTPILASLVSAHTRSLTNATSHNTMVKGETVWVRQPNGRTISCDSGAIWLTFANQFNDIVLEAGQTHRCTVNTALAIHALSGAVARVA